MRTTIKWREYPKEKPRYCGKFLALTRHGTRMAVMEWEIFGLFSRKPRWKFDAEITHFALPEDITTTEEPEAP